MISVFLFVSVFYGEPVLCDKKEKEGIGNLLWSRVLRPQAPVAARDPQNSVSLAQPAPRGVVPLVSSLPLQAAPSVPQSFPLFLPLFHFLPSLNFPLVLGGHLLLLLFTQEK